MGEYKDYTVHITFLEDSTGAVEYQLPYAQQVNDPKEGMKATTIEGNRGDGTIVIPGGKKSQEIVIHGKLFAPDGYKDLTEKITEMKTKVTTDVATLTMKHLEGVSWINDWSYTVRRITEIKFPKSFRTGVQNYSVTFLVLAY